MLRLFASGDHHNLEETNLKKALAAAIGIASLTGGILLGPATAGADPGSDPFELTCGNTTYEVVTGSGRGQFTPAFDAASNRVFHPTQFGDFSGTVYDEEGNVVAEFTEEGSETKGSSGKNKPDLVECSYLFDEVSDGSDPEFPEGYRFVGGGDVTGYWSPRKK